MVSASRELRDGDAAVICRHHWRIEPPQGETSDAVCGICGDTRTFVNGEWGKGFKLAAKKADD